MRSTLFVLVLILSYLTVTAQENVDLSDPIRARKTIVYSQVGAFGGLLLNQQGGSFTSSCDCEFTGGAGAGGAFGAMFERLTRTGLRWGVTLGYEGRGVEAKFTEREAIVQRSPATGQEFTVPVTFTNTGTLDMAFLSVVPYVKYDLTEWLFLRGGPQISYVISTNLKHVKSLAQDSVQFPTGEVASVSIPGSTDGSVVIQDEPLDDISPLQFGVAAAIGLEIKASKKLYISPVFQYVFPITSMTSGSGSFSIRSAQLLAEIRYIL